MKFIVKIFILILACSFFVPVQAQSYRTTKLAEYWKSRNRKVVKPVSLIRRVSRTPRRTAPKRSSRVTRRRAVRPSTASRLRQRNKGLSAQRYQQRRQSSRGVSRVRGNTQLPSTAIVTIKSLRQRQAVKIVDESEINLFRLGVSHRKNYQTTDFIQAAKLTKMYWSVLTAEGGLTEDLTKFELVVNGQAFDFQSDGTVNLYLPEFRLSAGESKSFDIGLKIEDASALPHIPGTLQVKLEKMVFVTETGGKEFPVVIRGNKVSQKIAFDPAPVANQAGSIFTGYSQRIYGRGLSAGEEEFVLAVDFQAHYDDFVIDEMTVRETLSSGDVDQFIDRIQAVDLKTGEVLDEARFGNGAARFYLSDAIFIPRNGERKIGFRVQIDEDVRVGNFDTRFELSLSPADVEVRGVGSGKELTDSQKNFSVNADTFFISGGRFVVRPGAKLSGLSVTESLEPVYRFIAENSGNSSVSLGRLSFNVRLGGLALTGGGVPGDFELRQVVNGWEASSLEWQASSVTGNVVRFDTLGDLRLPRGTQAEYVLKARLSELGDVSENDSVSAQILSDTSLQVGALSSVRASGANFIWSDHSGRPHTLSSEDWISGYLIPGLPTNSVVNYRR